MSTRYRTWLVLLLSAGVLCALAAGLFIRTWRMNLSEISPCWTVRGERRARLVTDTQTAEYHDCVEGRATLFLTRDYAEAKDASKAFLTLLTAILVASITFSEKIVDVTKSDRKARAVMVASWVLLLVAIAACGAALALMMEAAGSATYYPHLDYRVLSQRAGILYMVSGVAFGSALAALLVAGVISMAARQSDLIAAAKLPK